MFAYAASWNDCFPLAWWDRSVRLPSLKFGISNRLYIDDLLPYTRNYRIFVCGSRLSEKMSAAWELTRGEYNWSYGANPYLNGNGGQPWTSSSGITRPSKKILLTEMLNGYVCVWMDKLHWTTMRGVYPDGRLCRVNSLHNGKPNWLFVDGHVQSLTPRQTVVPTFMFNLRDEYPLHYPQPGSGSTMQSENDIQQMICGYLTLWGL
jgi:prepilin-type processing-associated H-X9-DG protein